VKSKYDCYTFLLLSQAIDSLEEWDKKRRDLRSVFGIGEMQNIRYSSSDNKVMKVISQFLNISELIDGIIISFLVVASEKYQFENIEQISKEYNCEKINDKTFNRMLVITHLVGFLLSGLTKLNQRILWITDEDDITANSFIMDKLFGFTKAALRALSPHDLYLLFDTDSVDNFEDFIARDLVAYTDLLTGVLMKTVPPTLSKNNSEEPMEIKFKYRSRNPNKENKDKAILDWASHNTGNLKKHIILIDQEQHFGSTCRELLISTIWDMG